MAKRRYLCGIRYFFGFFYGLYVFLFFLVFVGLLESEKRSEEEELAEEYAALAASTFTLPVSVIIPVKDEEGWIEDSLKAVLNLDYPELEIIDRKSVV